MAASLAGSETVLRIRVEDRRLEFEILTSGSDPKHSPENPIFFGTQNLLKVHSQSILDCLDQSLREGTTDLDQLVQLGRDFFNECFPAVVREELRLRPCGSLILRLDPHLISVPWELAHDGSDFLCCRFVIGRIVSEWERRERGNPRVVGTSIRALLLANPTGDLPSSTREGELLEKILSLHDNSDTDLVTNRVSRRQFLEMLGEYDVLHYSGHMDPAESTASFRLKDGSLGPEEIRERLEGGSAAPALFFNNACQTEVRSRNGSSTPSPAQALVGAGCLHYVGVLSSLRDESARQFARIFYQHLLTGESVGSSLLKAKLEIRVDSSRSDLTWAQHILYGNPNTGVFGETLTAAEVKTVVTLRSGEALRTLGEILKGFPTAESVLASPPGLFQIIFDRPSEAVRFSVIAENHLRRNGKEAPLRFGLQFGEVFIERAEGGGGVKTVGGCAAEESRHLSEIASDRQILLSKSVFDNARPILSFNEIQDIDDIQWLDHGTYDITGLESPLGVCEVGQRKTAPLAPPPDTNVARRRIPPDQEPVLGWRPACGQRIPTSPEWKIVEKLGEGGFGEVWRAVGPEGESRVFKFCFRADHVRALKREVTLFRILKGVLGPHPNIVKIHEVFFKEPPFYISMEDIRGTDLAAWCQSYAGNENLTEPIRLEIVARAADALQAAHDAGVIHRDVKPSNILIAGSPDSPESLVVKLTDFGIGRLDESLLQGNVTLTGLTETIRPTEFASGSGSRIYMAPELLIGKQSSIRSDLYSLGMVLYQVLLGDCDQPLTVDWEKDIRDPVLLEDLRGCLSGSPADRFSSAGEVAERLRTVPQRRQERQKDEDRSRTEDRRKRLMRGMAAAAGISMLLVAALGYGLRQAWIERENLQRSLYHSSIQAADRAIQEPNPVLARRILYEDCPERFRGFEWGWLVQKCNTDHRSFAQEAPITAMDLSPDNRFLVTGDEKGTIQIWDFREGTRLREVRAGPGGIRSMAIDADSKWVAVSIDGRVRVWELANGEEVPVPDPGLVNCGALRFFPNRPVLAAAADKPLPALILLDLSDGGVQSIGTPHEAAINDFVILPDGSKVITGGEDSLCCLINIRSGELLAKARLEGEWISAVGYHSETGALAVMAGRMLHIGTVDPFDPSQFPQMMVSSGGGLTFDPKGRFLGLNFDNHNVHVFDMGFKTTKYRLGGGGGAPRSVLFTEDVEYLLTLDEDGRVRQRSLQTAEFASVRLAGHEAWVHCIEFSPDGDHAATGSEDATVGVWNAKTGEAEQTFLTDSNVHSLRYSPDGDRLIAGTSSGEVFVWNPHSGETIGRFQAHSGSVVGLGVHPSNRQVASKGEDGEIKVWPMSHAGGEPTLSLMAAPEGLVAYSPDGRFLLSNGPQFTVKVWDSETGEEVSGFKGHTKPVRTLDFFPSLDRFATGDEDGEVIIWDWEARERIASFRSQVSLSHELIVTPDARRILTSVEIWDLENLRAILSVPVNCKSISPDGLYLAIGGAPHTTRIEGAFPYTGGESTGSTGKSLEEALEVHKRDYWKERTIRPTEGERNHPNLEVQSRGVTGSWDFEQRDWNAVIGRPIRLFTQTSNLGSPIHYFGTARAFGLPILGGKDFGVVSFTGRSREAGFMVYSNADNQYEEYVHAYSMVLDIYYPKESDHLQRAIYNSDPSNSTPAELVVSSTGGLGVDGVYHGQVTTGEWHRIAFTVKIDGTPLMAKYIDGRHVGTQILSEHERERWALQEGRRGRYFLLLSGRDCDAAPCHLNNFQFRDYIMSEDEVARLGGPSAGAISVGLSDGVERLEHSTE